LAISACFFSPFFSGACPSPCPSGCIENFCPRSHRVIGEICSAKPPGNAMIVRIASSAPTTIVTTAIDRPNVPDTMCSSHVDISARKGKRAKKAEMNTTPVRFPRPPTTTIKTQSSAIEKLKSFETTFVARKAMRPPAIPANSPESTKARTLYAVTLMP
jgi:hypothetical protein